MEEKGTTSKMSTTLREFWWNASNIKSRPKKNICFCYKDSHVFSISYTFMWLLAVIHSDAITCSFTLSHFLLLAHFAFTFHSYFVCVCVSMYLYVILPILYCLMRITLCYDVTHIFFIIHIINIIRVRVKWTAWEKKFTHTNLHRETQANEENGKWMCCSHNARTTW